MWQKLWNADGFRPLVGLRVPTTPNKNPVVDSLGPLQAKYIHLLVMADGDNPPNATFVHCTSYGRSAWHREANQIAASM